MSERIKLSYISKEQFEAHRPTMRRDGWRPRRTRVTGSPGPGETAAIAASSGCGHPVLLVLMTLLILPLGLYLLLRGAEDEGWFEVEYERAPEE